MVLLSTGFACGQHLLDDGLLFYGVFDADDANVHSWVEARRDLPTPLTRARMRPVGHGGVALPAQAVVPTCGDPEVLLAGGAAATASRLGGRVHNDAKEGTFGAVLRVATLDLLRVSAVLALDGPRDWCLLVGGWRPRRPLRAERSRPGSLAGGLTEPKASFRRLRGLRLWPPKPLNELAPLGQVVGKFSRVSRPWDSITRSKAARGSHPHARAWASNGRRVPIHQKVEEYAALRRRCYIGT